MTLDELVSAIDRSSATHNGFFDRSQRCEPLRDPYAIIRAWAPVTKTYCLGLASYLAALAGVIKTLEGTDAEPWEEALLVPTHLFAEEMSYGKLGIDNIHYHMFTRLARAWPEPSSTASNQKAGETTRATVKNLVDIMQWQLEQPFEGAGCILVVELTAPHIVDAYRSLLDAHRLSQEHRRYVDLHLETEPGHGARARQLVHALYDMPGAGNRIDSAVERIAAAFGAFWEALALEVFVT